VKSGNAVFQEYRVLRIYDSFAAERRAATGKCAGCRASNKRFIGLMAFWLFCQCVLLRNQYNRPHLPAE